MKSTVERLEGNKVKLSVEVEDTEFESALDAAFKRIASEVRLPGFRPGKAPRRLLEAQVGTDAARREAIRGSLPGFYDQAVRESGLQAIAAPEIDITSGEQSGPVTFDAVVEVRPEIDLKGYDKLEVTIPAPIAQDSEVDAQIERLRNQYGELKTVSRPAQNGDHVTLDVKGTRDGEDIAGLSTDDLLYEVGSASLLPELDDQVRGCSPGEIVEFDSETGEGPARFRVLVKEVKEKLLPEVTDEWADEVSEFGSVEKLRDDIASRIGAVKKVQAQLALRGEALNALVKLVDLEPPAPMVDAEMQHRTQDLTMRLEAQGASLPEYMQATGKGQEEILMELREAAVDAVKADLALTALAEAEQIDVTEHDVDREIASAADRMGQKPNQLRRQLDRVGQMPAVRSDLKKTKALEWLLEHVKVIDEEGRVIERSAIEPPKSSEELEAESEEMA